MIFDKKNLISKSDIFYELCIRGLTVDAIKDAETGIFSQTLIGVNESLCYLLPITNDLQLISDKMLDDVDFIIAAYRSYHTNEKIFYIIPCEIVKQHKDFYPLKFEDFEDCWDLLSI